MSFIDRKLVRVDAPPAAGKRTSGSAVAPVFWVFVTMAASAGPAGAATLSRSVDVKAEPAAVWAAIGPFCAIGAWHPAIASCATDGKSPPTRVLKTRDSATFVERQTARDDAERSYSYTFVSSPLPVTRYESTLKVTPRAGGGSTITWSGDFAANDAQTKPAQAALAGIYESGLAALKARLDD